MKNQLFEDPIESIKELPTEILEEMMANMNEEQMRKDFEEWIKPKIEKEWKELCEVFGKDNLLMPEAFREGRMKSDYVIWKASRESLVVELPSRHYSNMLDEIVMDAKSVYEALESQGIKWK